MDAMLWGWAQKSPPGLRWACSFFRGSGSVEGGGSIGSNGAVEHFRDGFAMGLQGHRQPLVDDFEVEGHVAKTRALCRRSPRDGIKMSPFLWAGSAASLGNVERNGQGCCQDLVIELKRGILLLPQLHHFARQRPRFLVNLQLLVLHLFLFKIQTKPLQTNILNPSLQSVFSPPRGDYHPLSRLTIPHENLTKTPRKPHENPTKASRKPHRRRTSATRKPLTPSISAPSARSGPRVNVGLWPTSLHFRTFRK